MQRILRCSTRLSRIGERLTAPRLPEKEFMQRIQRGRHDRLQQRHEGVRYAFLSRRQPKRSTIFPYLVRRMQKIIWPAEKKGCNSYG